MQDPLKLFDRKAHWRHRARAAGSIDKHDFLVREVAARLAERVAEVNRRFEVALGIGSWAGRLGRSLAGGERVGLVIEADAMPGMLPPGGPRLVCDEETLPIAPASVDLVLGLLTLHWVNDLPGTLIQIRAALKPDGLFLGAMLGGDTLAELREALALAERELGGARQRRVSPTADLAGLGDLLMRAGFALPVADTDVLKVTYPDPLRLMADLRGMGEANAVRDRPRGCASRRLLARAAEIYGDRNGTGEGRVAATFEVLFLSGWAPHPDQPKALRPGAATARLADALGSSEHSAGERALPRRGGSDGRDG